MIRSSRSPYVPGVDELTALAVAAGQGDARALDEFVRRSQAEVWRLCSHLAGRADADDLTQEVYLRALPALASFGARSTARTWLLAIARHAAADHLRAKRRRDGVWVAIPTEGRPDASGRVDLEVLLASLDDERRTAFVLTQLLGLRYQEAAAVCGCPVGTIRSRVARAREDLMRDVAEAEESG